MRTQRPCSLSLAAVLLAALAVRVAVAATATPLTAEAASRFVNLALACAHREYPNHLSHTLRSDADVRSPHELTPAFYGCYDWHSSVHGHWLLVRALRAFPQAVFAASARSALEESFTAENIAGELRYLSDPERTSFERPYGLAWLLQLAAELRSWNDPDARRWVATLAPLEAVAAAHVSAWLPKLQYPIRSGEHDQTAFAFGLIWDWAVIARDEAMLGLLRDRSRQFYGHDRHCPLDYEPSGEDFLSPCLGEADLMRRVLPRPEFAQWLATFLPEIPGHLSRRPRSAANWLAPGVVTDRADPKLAHLDGLNLSRAWMLEGIADSLPARDTRVVALRAAADLHRRSALADITGEHYAGGHWLGTIAIYLTTRGLDP